MPGQIEVLLAFTAVMAGISPATKETTRLQKIGPTKTRSRG